MSKRTEASGILQRVREVLKEVPMSEPLKPCPPERIWATINGASTRLPDGGRQLLGGWSEDAERPCVTEYVRADTCAQMSKDIGILLAEIDYLLEAYGDDRDPEDAAMIEQIRADWNRRSASVNKGNLK